MEDTQAEITASVDSWRDDDGIYYAIFHDASRKAVDQFTAFLDDISPTVAVEDEMFLFVDLSKSGLPSIRYMVQQFKGVRERHPNDSAQVFGAVVHQPNVIMSLLDSALRLVQQPGRDTVRFFPDGKQDEAINWLRENKGSQT